MNAYYACSTCSRYVKAGEGSCPFCQAPRTADVRPVRSGGALTVSRAQWLALGSTLVVAGAACSSAVSPTRSDTAAEATDASVVDGAQADGAVGDANADGGARVPDPSSCKHGTFACGDAGVMCERSSEFCVLAVPPTWKETRCEPYTATAAPDGAACGDCPQCGCVENQWNDPRSYLTPIACSASADGEIVVTETSVGPCYGAPPARLERVAA